jgi:hypothetical protein
VSVLLAAVLFASVLPCSAPAAPAGPPAGARGHVHGADVDHAPSLRAPCHCGCEKTPGTDAAASRLPLALLLASPSPSAPALVPLAVDGRIEAPAAPPPLVEHVPRHALA